MTDLTSGLRPAQQSIDSLLLTNTGTNFHVRSPRCLRSDGHGRVALGLGLDVC